MAIKEPKPLRHALEYHGARLVAFSLSLLPLSVALWLGRRLGDIWRLVDRKHRKIAESQVGERLGVPAATAAEFVKRNFRNYGMALAEFAHQSRMNAVDFQRNIDFGGFAPFIGNLRAEGKGVVFITAHFGNWEWANSIASTLGFTGGSIARPLDNPRLNEFVRGIRERNGLRILDKQGAIRKALGALRNNEVVGILIDQDAGRQGLMSPFLGKPASTITIPVELAMRTGSPLIVVGLRRGGEGGKRFTMWYSPTPFHASASAEPEAETRRLVDILNAELGKMIMEAPDQWFWIHRRWKSKGKR